MCGVRCQVSGVRSQVSNLRPQASGRRPQCEAHFIWHCKTLYIFRDTEYHTCKYFYSNSHLHEEAKPQVCLRRVGHQVRGDFELKEGEEYNLY